VRIRQQDHQAGFSLIEIVIVMALAISVAAVALPRFNDLVGAYRAKTAARAVERELQTARLKAVTTSRAMRVFLNCPVAGQLRVVEYTGVSTTDDASNRCDPIAFPVPGPNDMLRSTPQFDLPVVYLPDGSTVTATITAFEFSPRGAVSQVGAGGATTPLTAEALVTVTRAGWSYGITINVGGRIKIN
jgi:Tfp pilus assembly protein FimT